MSINTYEKQSGIISHLDIEKRLVALQSQQSEAGSSLSMSAETMYGSELPFYFLYKDGADAEGVKQTHVRLLDLVLNQDDPMRPFMTGDIAIQLDLEGFYMVMPNVEVCVIQAETPDEEKHHALALRHEIDKVYTILSETNAAGKEVTIKFHALEGAMNTTKLDAVKGDDSVTG